MIDVFSQHKDYLSTLLVTGILDHPDSSTIWQCKRFPKRDSHEKFIIYIAHVIPSLTSLCSQYFLYRRKHNEKPSEMKMSDGNGAKECGDSGQR